MGVQHNIQGNPYVKNYEFDYTFPQWGHCSTSCDPSALFDARIEVFRHARRADHIGTEIRSVAVQSNQTLGRAGGTVRAHFSNIERAPIIHAAQQADAVASHIELDLRVGASFTRHLTLSLRPVLQRCNLCQFPTLGFIVERYLRVRNFIPEPFWGINLIWARKHLFDRMTVVILYEWCLTSQNAQVQKVKTKPTSKWKPLPLTTLELQNQKVLQLAEKLYQKDQFDQGMDLRGLVQKQAQGGRWAGYAMALVEGGFSWPPNGRNNDKAHPPIHPANFRVHDKDAQGSKTDISILYGPETFNASGLVILERNST
ncbi:DNA topoisomerase [Pyrenochaeta sp. MPI-SDFR-AT-0127]|nr:DNA topoisomerase [Pyrenochaeta sp. MPI-SDFR-AT-0127]